MKIKISGFDLDLNLKEDYIEAILLADPETECSYDDLYKYSFKKLKKIFPLDENGKPV